MLKEYSATESTTYSRLPLLRACFNAGALPSILMPLLYMLYVFFETGRWTMLPILLSFGIGALIVGLLISVTAGLFILSLLNAYQLNTPFIAGFFGLGIAILFLILMKAPLEYPVFFLFGFLGLITGSVASFLSLKYIRINQLIELAESKGVTKGIQSPSSKR